MTNTALAQVEDSAVVSSSVEFTIDRSLLLKALGHVQSVVEKRNTIPILSNVKLEVAEGALSLTATDMDIAVTEKVAADVTEEGALTVPAHTFYDIVRKLPEGAQVEIAGDAGASGKLRIASGSCNFSLSCLPVADFPVMDCGDMEYIFELASAELLALIDKTKFAISTEETRYYLNGIYFHAKKNDNGDEVLCTVATDGHRLAKVEVSLPDGADGIPGVIIPRKTVIELRKLIEESEGEVEVELSATKISFASGDAVLISKLIDGTFPDYTKVIPTANNMVMEVNKDSFARAVDRVSTITSDKTRAIKLVVEKGKLTLLATNEENGTAKEELEVSYDSGTIEIGFNSRYVLEMLAGLEGENIKFIFADSAAPTLVRDAADESALYVIMPMRI